MPNTVQGEYLRKRREKLRRSQRWLAEAAGLSIRTVMRAEGGAEIASESLLAICAVLGVDAADVPTGQETDVRTVEAPPTEVPAEEIPNDSCADVSEPARRSGLRRFVPACINLVVCVAAVVASFAVYDNGLRHRLGPVGGELWERQELVSAVHQGRILDLLDASSNRPAMRSTVLSMAKDTVVTYPYCDGSAGTRLRERFVWGGCEMRGESPAVVGSPGGTTAYSTAPVSAAMGAGIVATLRAGPGRRIEARFVHPGADGGPETPGPWFEPNVSLEKADPPFPEGGRLEVRIGPAGAAR